MTEELSKGFTGIEINGVRFSNIKEMLIYMNKQRVRIINLEKENAELKAQIEKMKCCENCNNFQHRIDHRCNTKCKNLSEWEIKEND